MLGRRPAQSGLAAAAGADRFETDDTALSNEFDIVVEAAGALAAVQSAVAKAARGAKIVLLGFPGHGVGVPIVVDDIVNGDLTIIGSFSYTSTAWRRVVELLNTGRLDLDFLITHRYRLDQWSEAIDALRTATGVRGKVLVEISPS
jgi:threonine dehydrogenase-like Zn-dependent dehydrogenase